MNKDQQTFSDEHCDRLVDVFGGQLSVYTLELLYRGSYSATFAPDLRAAIREVVKPDTIEEWERTS